MPRTAKIDLNKVSLHGRSAELNILNAAYNNIVASLGDNDQQQHTSSSSVITLSGSSGTGKSYLVERWASRLVDGGSVLVASAVFDHRHQGKAPFSAISQVVVQLCDGIPGDKADLMRTLHEEIGEEMKLLFATLPLLSETLTPCSSSASEEESSTSAAKLDGRIGSETQSLSGSSNKSWSLCGSSASGCATAGGQASFQRFAFIFREFFRCVCTCIPSCYVVVFDDLQYADENSRQILSMMAGDSELKRFLLVLTLHDTPEQLEFINHLSAHATKANRDFHNLPIGCLSLEDVNQIFSELTLTRKERTLPLAKLAFEKTRGNPFFTLQFIHILQQREVLYFSTTTYKFEWNLESARQHTQLADNAAEAVRERVAAFSDFDGHDRELMTIASYLGKSFGVDDVTYVKHAMDSLNKTTTTSLVEAVNIATLAASRLVVVEGQGCGGDTKVFEKMTEEQFLESARIGKYKFSHDSIHHFFLSKEESTGWKGADFGLRVGTAILVLARSLPSRKSDLLFSAVNVLNEGIHNVFDNQSKIFLASLNLEVAEMAAERSAFFSSTTYLDYGRSLLMETKLPWRNHKELTHHMWRVSIGTELACGRNQKCRDLAQQLLEKGGSFEERADARFSIALSLRAEDKRAECFQVLLEGLETMGEILPTKPSRLLITRNKYRVRRLLQKVPIGSILGMPILKDEKIKLKLKYLNMVLITAYRLSSWNCMRMATLRMLILTLRHGLCKYSPLVFAAYGWMLIGDKKYDDGSCFGELSNKVINKLNAKVNLPITTFVLSTLVNHIHYPMHRGLNHLKRGFRVGMESGDMELAMMCASTDVAYQFTLAYPLEAIWRTLDATSS